MTESRPPQVRPIAAERIGVLGGVLAGDDVAALDEAIRLNLGL